MCQINVVTYINLRKLVFPKVQLGKINVFANINLRKLIIAKYQLSQINVFPDIDCRQLIPVKVYFSQMFFLGQIYFFEPLFCQIENASFPLLLFFSQILFECRFNVGTMVFGVQLKRISFKFLAPLLKCREQGNVDQPPNIEVLICLSTSIVNGNDVLADNDRTTTLTRKSTYCIANLTTLWINFHYPTCLSQAILIEFKLSSLFILTLIIILNRKPIYLQECVILVIDQTFFARQRQFEELVILYFLFELEHGKIISQLRIIVTAFLFIEISNTFNLVAMMRRRFTGSQVKFQVRKLIV